MGSSYQRPPSKIREWVTVDGSSGFRAEPGRYHPYASWACPWAHSAIIVRMLKGLAGVVSMSVLDPIRDERGWAFRDVPGRARSDQRLRLPLRGVPGYGPRLRRPVWDEWARNPDLDLHPEELRPEIDALNERVYETVNNGVHRAGSSKQPAYQQVIGPMFETLDWLDARLADRRYLFGDRPTLADRRLFTTLLRFDPVYFTHFKCNVRRIVDYPACGPTCATC